MPNMAPTVATVCQGGGADLSGVMVFFSLADTAVAAVLAAAVLELGGMVSMIPKGGGWIQDVEKVPF